MITARQDLNNTSFHTEHDKKQSLSDKILELNMPSAPLVLTMNTTRAEHQHIDQIWIERCIVIPKEPYQTHFQSLIWLFLLYQHDQPLTPIVGQTFFSYKTNNPSITSLRSVTTDSREESRGGLQINGIPTSSHSLLISSGQILACISPICALCNIIIQRRLCPIPPPIHNGSLSESNC